MLCGYYGDWAQSPTPTRIPYIVIKFILHLIKMTSPYRHNTLTVDDTDNAWSWKLNLDYIYS